MGRGLSVGRRLPLPINLQHTLWACGLRGAVAYGLAVNLPNIDAESDEGIPAIESATLVIVLVSTLLFGGVTGTLPLLHLLSVAWFCKYLQMFVALSQFCITSIRSISGCVLDPQKGPHVTVTYMSVIMSTAPWWPVLIRNLGPSCSLACLFTKFGLCLIALASCVMSAMRTVLQRDCKRH